MKVKLIVAMDLERGIGRDNDLMWHLPDDMKFFKDTTKDQVVVMGRRNYDSIPEKFRPLPGRENVILTRNVGFEADNCEVFNSLEACLDHYKEDERVIFIIGGGEIYKLALEAGRVEEMFITHVDKVYKADTFFPMFDENKWNTEIIDEHPQDERHEAGYVIKKYLRKE
jgi:dihydrofolate reductase